MIYLENIQTEQFALIPSNGLMRGAYCHKFALKSTISGEAVMTEDYGGIICNRGYYGLHITLPAGMAVGEYAYYLSDNDGNELASGLCQIGDYSRPIQQGKGGFTLKQAK